MALSMPAPAGARLDPRELIASDMIPYTVHYDDHTVVTKDDGLLQVIRIDGLHFESLSAEQIRQFERRRNTVLRAIAGSDRMVYVHLIRRKVAAYPDGDGEVWFAREFNAAWRARYASRAFYVNEIYVSIVCTRFRRGAPGLLDRAFGALSGGKGGGDDALAGYAQLAKDLYAASQLLLQSLSDYGARRLCVQRRPVFAEARVARTAARREIVRCHRHWDDFLRLYGEAEDYSREEVEDFLGEEVSEIASFLHYLVNLQQARVPVSSMPLDRALAASWLDFGLLGNTMVAEGLGERRAAAVLSMAEWPARTPSRMLDEFLRQPVEAIITQSFAFTDRISAEQALRQERRRVTVNDREGLATEDRDELARGLQELASGRSVNGLHHLTMLVHVPVATGHGDAVADRRQTFAKLDAAVAMFKKAFVNLGVRPVRERFALETFFWAQLPGQAQHFLGRRGKIASANFAGFASLHNFAQGRIDGNLWGPAIMPFETESGTAHYFNFHREMDGMVSGHTAITADTGSGKTTILSALIAMADKVRPRVVWFDNREGARVFMEAMGARHTTLTVQGRTGWNPFQLPDTAENRAYLVELQMLMRTCYGGAASADDIERFQHAVSENYSLPPADRRLRNVAWCYGQGGLARDMRVWHGARGEEGANAGVFDNADDNLDLAACRYHCYEMRQLIRDGVARPELPVVLSYPFHRIAQAMNGEPFILVLEEGQNLVRHPYWRDKIDSYIMQMRRNNGVLIFVTPDPKYLYCETDAILKQTATKIYLPNAEARRADYVDALGLTEAEFRFIRDTPPGQRKFLIRRGNESVRAAFDLSDLPQFIPVLSSNDKGVALMKAIQTELGTDDPAQWVPVFMARALAQNTHNVGRG
ncbi:type VI secretion protein [Cupriavidus respiraculi]|uniref:Type IV secretion system protein virB4 n=2 Tax=Cupriavidus respiraculi TaxID=195930 RepID=A0ABN7ZIV8_9BURK|nr:Type IV secretion system protein virB4 [Cupriavidus respiraculi]